MAVQREGKKKKKETGGIKLKKQQKRGEEI